MLISRRNLLKLGTVPLLSMFISPFVRAQSVSDGAALGAGKVAKPPLDGNVTYNAGWVVPLEDRPGLLEIEARKNKEFEELKKSKGPEPAPSEPPKEKPKSFSDKLQGILGKVKSFF